MAEGRFLLCHEREISKDVVSLMICGQWSKAANRKRKEKHRPEGTSHLSWSALLETPPSSYQAPLSRGLCLEGEFACPGFREMITTPDFFNEFLHWPVAVTQNVRSI